MIISKLILNNFGRHERLVVDSPGNVVGLLGANGMGKSTVLDALKFALTGETDAAMMTYVRHGIGNASVEAVFQKNGNTGVIFRQFGKTPKRSLKWGGKEIKSAKEVDKIMSEIFGADKQAVSNAVFISQGMLTRVLMSKDADRLQTFLRMLNLNFCASRAERLDGKIQALSADVVDCGPLIDAANKRLEQAMVELLQVEEASKQFPDHTLALADLRSRQTAEQRLTVINTSLSQLALQSTELDVLFSELARATKLAVRDPAVLSRMLEEKSLAESRLKCMQAEETSYTQALWQRQSLDNINAQLATMQTRKAAIEAEMAVLRTDKNYTIADMELFVSKWKQQADNYANYNSTYARYLEAQKQLRDIQDEAFPVTDDLETQARALQAELSASRNAAATMSAFLQKQRQQVEFMRTTGVCDPVRQKEGITCGSCGLRISNPEELSADHLQRMEQLILDARENVNRCTAEFTAVRSKIAGIEAAVADHRQREAAAKATLNTIDQQLRSISVTAPEDQIQGNLQAWTSILQNTRTLQGELDTLGAQMAQFNEEKKKYTLVKTYEEQGVILQEDYLLELRANLTQYAQTMKELSEVVDRARELHVRKQEIDRSKTWNLSEKANLDQRLKLNLPEVVSSLPEPIRDGTLENMVAELERQQSAYEQMRGRVVQAQVAVKAVEDEQRTLAARQSGQERLISLIADLRTLRDMLRDDGLPLQVVRHHFKTLARITQQTLIKLDANFRVMPDAQDGISFEFVRLDEQEHQPLPMVKLSGGQRMRLCTAFLIAVQQHLVKDVGLLVLDEPSTHVDQQGVDQLAELLANLGTTLKNTEVQIWISDHHPVLKTCFDNVVTLT